MADQQFFKAEILVKLTDGSEVTRSGLFNRKDADGAAKAKFDLYTYVPDVFFRQTSEGFDAPIESVKILSIDEITEAEYNNDTTTEKF